MMMGWLASGLDSVSGWLSLPGRSRDEENARDLEATRCAMLDALAESGTSLQSKLALRIRFATEAKSLWYLRSDLMAVLSKHHGEPVAREKLAALADGFHDMLPAALQRTSQAPRHRAHRR